MSILSPDVVLSGSLGLQTTGSVVSSEIQSGTIISPDASKSQGYCLMDICINTSQSYIVEKDGTRVQASNPIFENDKVVGTEYKKTIHPDETYTDMIRVNIQK